MFVQKAFAAIDLSTAYSPAKSLGKDITISDLLNPIIYNVLIVSGIVAFIVILLSGFSYITAAGDKGKTEQAQHMLNYGIIGLVVVVAAFLVTRLMGSILGFKFFG